ncbi:major facilitator superfamily domain-containing protein [Chaetomium fimeti]|uniref:Major facilitator superfamily domain-containing protein n=1 Tax=Chaetomium fimeti TaxID=1854472 RepID=A0AAE0HB57_9PEZI|nr:major facilitator superfamily domain-containing protein [Chaetomium fimeti]
MAASGSSATAREADGQKELVAAEDKTQVTVKRGVRFWGTFVALCCLSFISALDVAIVTTALPTVTAAIGGAEQYVWIANSFVVASCVLQPLFGQLADVFGRRRPFIASVVLFTLGSGIAGGAKDAAMLIAGRAVQGAGAGGIVVMLDIVCCDLVPLRERGKYLGLMFSWSGVGAALGPPVGGALAEANWRWMFYMNIPICGVALAFLLLFMRFKTGTAATEHRGIGAKFRRLDIIGNLIFTSSMISLLIGLVQGGTDEQHEWSSFRIIVPIVLGVAGWAAFHVHQAVLAPFPSVPPRLFTNRTSAIAYGLTFTSSVVLQATAYFFPVYLQAVQGTTVLESGTYFLPFALSSLVFAVLAGILLSTFGAYRPLHAAAFALSSLAFGLFTLLDGSTSKVAWVWYQLIAAAGSGLVMSTLLPALMASLPESHVASASATYSFFRTFGYVWGVTLPGIIFNAAVGSNLESISDPTLRAQMADGAAYSFASAVHGLRRDGALGPVAFQQMTDVYSESLRVIWWLCLGISLVSLLAVPVMRGLELRKELETEYGLDDGVKVNGVGSSSSDEEVGRAEEKVKVDGVVQCRVVSEPNSA